MRDKRPVNYDLFLKCEWLKAVLFLYWSDRYEVRLLNNETVFAVPELLPAALNRMHGY
jgi:hypothetical protein